MAQKKKSPAKTTASKSAKNAKSRAVTKPPVAKKPAKAAASRKPVAKATSTKAPAKAAKRPAEKKVEARKPVATPKAAPAVAAAKTAALKPVAKAAEKAPKPVAKPASAPAVVAPSKAAAAVASMVNAKAMARPAGAAPRAMPAAVHKTAAPKLTAPVAPPRPPVTNGAHDASAGPRKPVNQRHGFKTGEAIVYPAHGVGRIIGIEEQEIAGISLELFVIQFEKDKLTLRVPTAKLESVGMRKLAEEGIVKRAMDTLKGKARIKRTMWSRRAQEYEAKINSGDLVAIAEVVRDLYRSETQPEQSYSERQLYESALDRMAREIAVVDKLDERSAMQRITEVLSRSARGRRAAEEESAEETKAA